MVLLVSGVVSLYRWLSCSCEINPSWNSLTFSSHVKHHSVKSATVDNPPVEKTCYSGQLQNGYICFKISISWGATYATVYYDIVRSVSCLPWGWLSWSCQRPRHIHDHWVRDLCLPSHEGGFRGLVKDLCAQTITPSVRLLTCNLLHHNFMRYGR